MKKSLVLVALLLVFAVSGFADTTFNNFTGYSDYWHPFGFPNTATYGETFTAPSSPNTNLADFGFYMGDSLGGGNIVLGAYIATWTGTQAGTLLYSSSAYNYPNNGDSFVSFTTGGLTLTPGANYVMFLSISQFYGQSSGETYVSQGSHTIPGGDFVYNNNSGDFNALFNTAWSGPLTPDWAVNLHFTSGASTPEPGTLLLLGTGLLAGIGAIRRKLS